MTEQKKLNIQQKYNEGRTTKISELNALTYALEEAETERDEYKILYEGEREKHLDTVGWHAEAAAEVYRLQGELEEAEKRIKAMERAYEGRNIQCEVCAYLTFGAFKEPCASCFTIDDRTKRNYVFNLEMFRETEATT